MELQRKPPSLHERPRHLGSKPLSARWVKEWVPQSLASTGGSCLVLKWIREDVLEILKEKSKESMREESEPEPTSEVLFLCSFEGCGKTFIDAGALRKHFHIHGDRQYVCQYEGCGKKFLDSSKLKRHHLIHTGQRDHVCSHEGCGKAFSLDFNLRAHMRTHTQENYHTCPHQNCGKRYAHDYKLQAHIRSSHGKDTVMIKTKYIPPPEKLQSSLKTSTAVQRVASHRPYKCSHEGCDKAYIHKYKLDLHLRREHPGCKPDGKGNHALSPMARHDAAEHDPYQGRGSAHKIYKRNADDLVEVLPSRAPHRDEVSSLKPQWHARRVFEEDSEETEEDHDSMDADECGEGSNTDEETDDED